MNAYGDDICATRNFMGVSSLFFHFLTPSSFLTINHYLDLNKIYIFLIYFIL